MAFVEDAPATRWHLAFMSDQALERQHGDRALDYRASMAILFMVMAARTSRLEPLLSCTADGK